jgi:epoxyqueuosine reductase
MTPDATLTAHVLDLGRRHGLDAVGVARARPLLRARQALQERKAAGLHAGMQFTYRNPVRSTDPTQAVPGARSVLVGARAYFAPTPVPVRPERPVARVARYAWEDYYAPLREALWTVAHHLRGQGFKAVAYADDNTMVDREVAYEAGLGWFGKNANLLIPGAGSWFVLGSVVTTAPLAPSVTEPVADGCGTCRRCVDACPTGAIVAPGVIDARRCLAWVLQRPGVVPEDLRTAIGDRLYGCDDCQDVCPVNRRHEPEPETEPETEPEPAAANAHADPRRQAWVDVVDLLAATDTELLARHGRWYLHDREVRWLRRNALIVLGNVADGRDPSVAATLATYLAHADEMLRIHAEWAARQLGLGHLMAARP